MKLFLGGIAAAVLLAAGSARAGDIVYKPIDTSKLVVQPSNATGSLVGRTISTIGKTAPAQSRTTAT